MYFGHCIKFCNINPIKGPSICTHTKWNIQYFGVTATYKLKNELSFLKRIIIAYANIHLKHSVVLKIFLNFKEYINMS